MKPTLLVSLALAASLVAPALAQTTPTPAPAPAVAPAAHGNRVTGSVTAVDTTKNSVTVQERNSATPTTFTLGPNARIHVLTPAAVSDLSQGTFVQVSGPVTGATVDARNITILPELPKHQEGRAIVGTVAATTPSLTVTADGTTYTVTTLTARVERRSVGSFSDITVGKNVNARVDSALVATEVNVMPARVRRTRRAANP